ncbi:MFS transporter [Bradyrhizobium sp. U87765 SZCCT0131]|uniref:MFS transporter n=1 Tax=unclassified Bradyrhizobium TaxID=2631580 RepID=UPI001BAA4BFD|nr:MULTISPECIES: MFS transporter [unclassified Bradyrhizobium]MBR1219321.1 MFS transporter [Bradyrhizobium sp. U87765 SZCCT0131]MBR1261972.1 MFS transporter [Bradyrhizobium sp. U87765 SZCCT0134]MBR1306175.1 MFS transporter [Bradyrhizobium sp. U87765 SZCCT0110]MBR1317754.1 MFS transporter [Bradyrhizobium sp. U87765 SZCCT0109]MBR1351456.1 MFS transporter [Bradyrhizobium sp. U87765 SZCCT0048]
MSTETSRVVLPDDTSLTAFYRDMNVAERRTFWACATGWALDGMDFMIYPLVIGTIIKLWNVDAGLAGLAGTVTLLASAIGGWVAGFLCDRIGRVRTLQITIVWFSLFSLVCAFVQNFDQLLIARALLGFGFGGEWAAGAVLMGETIRAQYRGRAVGSVQSGWAIGWGLAVLAQALLFSLLPAEQAWRWMFALGVLPALLVFYLRRYVEEPKVAAETLARQTAAGDRPAMWEIFSGPILKTTILASLVATGCQGGYYAITFWVPRFLTTERKLSIVSSTGYLAALIVGSFIGYLVGAWLADRIGRRNLFLIFSLGAIAVVLLYTQMALSNELLWVLGFPLGFFASGYFSGIGAFLTELYPTRLRGSGQGFCYNFGRGIGALFPFLVGFLSQSTTLANAIAIFAVAAYALFFLAAYALPETRGRVLSADG